MFACTKSLLYVLFQPALSCDESMWSLKEPRSAGVDKQQQSSTPHMAHMDGPHTRFSNNPSGAEIIPLEDVNKFMACGE